MALLLLVSGLLTLRIEGACLQPLRRHPPSCNPHPSPFPAARCLLCTSPSACRLPKRVGEWGGVNPGARERASVVVSEVVRSALSDKEDPMTEKNTPEDPQTTDPEHVDPETATDPEGDPVENPSG